MNGQRVVEGEVKWPFFGCFLFIPSHNHQCSGGESPEGLLSEGGHLGEAILVKGLQVAKREVTEEGQPEKMGTGPEVNGSVLLCPCLLCPFHMHIPQCGGYLDSWTKSHTSGQVQDLAQAWHSMHS